MRELKNIKKKLYEFQQSCPEIKHDCSNDYSGYTYASLNATLKAVKQAMKPLKMGLFQLVNDNRIDTVIFDSESGEEITSSTAIPEEVKLKGMNEYQALGSAITYLKRYALTSMLGISAESDNDAIGEQQNTTPKKPQKPWLNLFDKNGNETGVFLQIKDKHENNPIELSQLRKYYKISKASVKSLNEIGIQ